MKVIPTLKSILVLFSLFLIISACKKNCKTEEIRYSVLEKTKAEVPYTGYDTLTFIRTSVGDTHVFIGQGKTMDYEYTSTSADCGNKYIRENYYFTYESNTFDDPILIGYNSPGGSFYHYLLFQEQKFEGNLFFLSPIADLDSIRVIDKVYYNVQMIPHVKPDVSPFIAYFHEKYGCIKIKFQNNETWELLSLKQ